MTVTVHMRQQSPTTAGDMLRSRALRQALTSKKHNLLNVWTTPSETETGNLARQKTIEDMQ